MNDERPRFPGPFQQRGQDLNPRPPVMDVETGLAQAHGAVSKPYEVRSGL